MGTMRCGDHSWVALCWLPQPHAPGSRDGADEYPHLRAEPPDGFDSHPHLDCPSRGLAPTVRYVFATSLTFTTRGRWAVSVEMFTVFGFAMGVLRVGSGSRPAVVGPPAARCAQSFVESAMLIVLVCPCPPVAPCTPWTNTLIIAPRLAGRARRTRRGAAMFTSIVVEVEVLSR